MYIFKICKILGFQPLFNEKKNALNLMKNKKVGNFAILFPL